MTRQPDVAPPPLRRDRLVQGWVAASAVSAAGDGVFLVAFAWAAVHEASPAVAGALLGVGMAPRALLLLVGGALADRWRTRPIMLSCNGARIAVLLGAVVAWAGGTARVPVLLAVALLFGAADALYEPANATLSRQLVRTADLGAVSGMSQVTRRVATLVGAGAGGWLAATEGLVAAMLVDALSFAVVGVVLWVVVRPRFALDRRSDQTVVRGVAEGFAYLRDDRVARTLTVALTGLNLFVGPVVAVGVALASAQRGWGAGTVGAVEATIGGGAALGAVAVIRRRPRADVRAGFLLLVLQAGALAGFGASSRPAVLAAAAVVGLTSGTASVLLSAAFQRTVRPAYLGRVASMVTLGDTTLLPLTMPLFGWLAHEASVATACAAYGAGMLVLASWGATRRAITTPSASCAARARTARTAGTSGATR